MKGYIIIIGLFLSTALPAQSKQDYQWFFGKDQNVEIPGYQGLRMNFNEVPFGVTQATNGLSYDRNNTSICDKEGNLLMYTNGCAIANRNHEIMMNGDSINWGNFAEYFWFDGDCRAGYPGRQDILLLPDPAYDKGYYLIHKTVEYNYDTDKDSYVQNLKYSYIDLELDNGLGAVVEKNEIFYTSGYELVWSYLTAARHANGRDWWIIQPDRDNDVFLIFLLNEEGINLDYTQPLDFITEVNSSAGGKAKFSPDGSKYAFFTKVHGLYIYDFDREAGKLSNLRTLDFTYPDPLKFSDLEFSSNSELLYLAATDSLWQIDLLEDNLADGKILIDVPNGYADPIPTSFFDLALAPDCKIYIRSGSSVKTFDVIHKPNERGRACDLVQQAVSFPQFTSTGTFPNFPRFRVDEEEKCDPTITSFLGEAVYYRRDLEVYPNPVQSNLNITIPEQQSGQVIIYNLEGKIWMGPIEVSNQSDIHQVDVSALATGTYIVEYVSDDRKERLVYNQKFVKI